MNGAPFIVYALPRSRSFWLSQYLSYGDYECAHEHARHLRTMGDIRSWLAQDYTGTAETTVAPWWRLVRQIRPDIRTLVVRRPVGEVVESLMRLDMAGVCSFGRDVLTRQIQRLDRALDRIEANVQGVMSVRFDDLADEDVCAEVFEHCLGYAHDHDWWASIEKVNLQVNMRAMMRYYLAHKEQIEALAKAAKYRVLASLPRRVETDGVTLQEETFDASFPDAKRLFAEHALAVGEPPDAYLRKNIPLIKALADAGSAQIYTARSNGRMFGYLLSVIAPSLESEKIKTAIHTLFYASPDAPRVGMKLQRAAVASLWDKGVDEVYLRSGPRGDGPRMGAVYQRMGAVPDGEWYKLTRAAA